MKRYAAHSGTDSLKIKRYTIKFDVSAEIYAKSREEMIEDFKKLMIEHVNKSFLEETVK